MGVEEDNFPFWIEIQLSPHPQPNNSIFDLFFIILNLWTTTNLWWNRENSAFWEVHFITEAFALLFLCGFSFKTYTPLHWMAESCSL